jgi:large subunit ribosomal protein L25
METIILAVEPRVIKKKDAEKLRKNGKVPAIIYHKGEDNIPVTIESMPLEKLIHSSDSHIIDLQFPDGKTIRSFIKNTQFHPVTDKIIHADFQLFTADEVIEMEVPTTFTGDCLGVRIGGGKLLILLHSLTLKGKPADIPEHFTVDISNLELGHTFHVSELPLGEAEGKIEIMTDHHAPVVSVIAPRKDAEAVAAEAPAEA